MVAVLGCLCIAVSAIIGPSDAAERKPGALLPGGNSKQPINIEAVKLDYFDKEQKLIYTGNVVATQGDSTLKASALTIFLVPKGADATAAPSTSKVQRMLATGPVTLLQRDQVGTGDNGVYDKVADTVILTGNVTLSQGPNVTKGDKLTYDLKTGQAVVTGRVKSMFLPENNDKTTSCSEKANRNDEPVRHAGRKGSAIPPSGSRGM